MTGCVCCPSPARARPSEERRSSARSTPRSTSSADTTPGIVVNVDADISFEPDYFERLLAEFENDPSLGIASGSAFELDNGAWRQRFVTGSTVWGASRAFRWECLQQILPFEERVAWDGIDEFKANARGWRTHAFEELPFRHHRREGSRDGSALRARRNQGHAAYYVGYRPWYLVLRSVWNARREPASLGMIWGYGAAALKREPRSDDAAARAYLARAAERSPAAAPLARGDGPPRPLTAWGVGADLELGLQRR